jgi:hypothetical protein
MWSGPHLHEEGVPGQDKGTAEKSRISHQMEVSQRLAASAIAAQLRALSLHGRFPSTEASRSTCCTPSDSHKFPREGYSLHYKSLACQQSNGAPGDKATAVPSRRNGSQGDIVLIFSPCHTFQTMAEIMSEWRG